MKSIRNTLLLFVLFFASCASAPIGPDLGLDYDVSMLTGFFDSKCYCAESFKQSCPDEIAIVEPFALVDYYNTSIFSKRVHSDSLSTAAKNALMGAIGESPFLSSSRIIGEENLTMHEGIQYDLLDVVDQLDDKKDVQIPLPTSVQSFMETNKLPYAMFFVLKGHEPMPHHIYGSLDRTNGCITWLKVLVADAANDTFVFYGRTKHTGRHVRGQNQKPTNQQELIYHLQRIFDKYPIKEESELSVGAELNVR